MALGLAFCRQAYSARRGRPLLPFLIIADSRAGESRGLLAHRQMPDPSSRARTVLHAWAPHSHCFIPLPF